jgi:chromate transporter
MIGELWEVFALFARLSLAGFGGGAAIVPPMEQAAVAHGWVTHRQFVDVYALGQMTPGPGMLVATVLGYRAAGPLGALVASVAMFLPPSLLTWVITERWSRLRGSPLVDAVRAGMAPVAVGLIATGAYAIGRTAIDGPVTALIAVAVAVILLRFRVSPALPVLLSGLAGWLLLR